MFQYHPFVSPTSAYAAPWRRSHCPVARPAAPRRALARCRPL